VAISLTPGKRPAFFSGRSASWFAMASAESSCFRTARSTRIREPKQHSWPPERFPYGVAASCLANRRRHLNACAGCKFPWPAASAALSSGMQVVFVVAKSPMGVHKTLCFCRDEQQLRQRRSCARCWCVRSVSGGPLHVGADALAGVLGNFQGHVGNPTAALKHPSHRFPNEIALHRRELIG